MKHYLRHGASGYMYWNISTLQGGMSTWGWPQNSLVSVDEASHSYRFNHDYYLLKHLTHFVDVGAQRIKTVGTMDDALAFRNPDHSLIVLLRNELNTPRKVQVQAEKQSCLVELLPDSIATLTMRTA